MPIPKYDEMYRAFLDCLADGQTHRSKEDVYKRQGKDDAGGHYRQ